MKSQTEREPSVIRTLGDGGQNWELLAHKTSWILGQSKANNQPTPFLSQHNAFLLGILIFFKMTFLWEVHLTGWNVGAIAFFFSSLLSAYDNLSGHVPVSLFFALGAEKGHVCPTFIPHCSEQHRFWSGLSPLSGGVGGLLLTLPGTPVLPRFPWCLC